MGNDLLPDIVPILSAIWFIISHGGWVVFVLITIYILYQLYLNEIQTQYIQGIEWTYLEIKPPAENLLSMYNMENIFIQLHQLFDNWTFQEKYVEGKVVFWISLEIISLGGKISYILRIPTKQRDLIEATFYANFPNIEITEVADYLSNFEYNPDDPKIDMFATEFILAAPQIFPIKTYNEFAGLKSPDGDKVLDPLASLFETFTRIDPSEFYGMQIIIRPKMNADLQKEAEEFVAKTVGEKTFMALDDATKGFLTSIKVKAGKPIYDTKIRLMHIGTKEVFNKNAKKLILSPLKIFTAGNSFKPAFAPKLDYRISPTLEAPYINYYVRKRKIDLFRAFKSRSTWIGEKMYSLNVEELASIYHFPVTADASTPTPVETVDMKKAQPPADLPIG
jgi:hypothetical protein